MFDSEAFSTVAFSPDAWDFGGVPEGGFVLSGDALFASGKVMPVEGGVDFSGSAPMIVTAVMSAGGSIVFSGSASLNFETALGSGGRHRPLVGAGK